MPIQQIAKKGTQLKADSMQSAVSYASGSGLAAGSYLSDVIGFLQATGIAIGCAVVAVRLVHDVIVLRRYIKSGDKKDNRK